MLTSKTYSPRAAEIERDWFVVDAADQTLGGLASRVAAVLEGKHKPTYATHLDSGDHVIVINAAKVKVTGSKLTNKTYYRHTGYPGGIRATTAGKLLQSKPERLLEMAVRGMLPKSRLGRQLFTKLKVYRGADHPHAAQRPVPIEL